MCGFQADPHRPVSFKHILKRQHSKYDGKQVLNNKNQMFTIVKILRGMIH